MMSSCNQGKTKKMCLSFPFWITINFLADSCYNYSTLSDADRKRTFVTPLHGKVLCDKLLLKRWYRFEGDAGTRMPTTPVDDNHCNTVRSGWLNGTQPTIGDGEVIRTVCFTRGYNKCSYLKEIKVKNCGSYFIYKLGQLSICDSRYCGTD